VASVEGSAGGFLDGVYDQKKVGVKGAPHLLARVAGAVGRLFHTDRANPMTDSVDVLSNVAALYRLDGTRHFRKEPEQSALILIFHSALARRRALGAHAANSIPDYRFEFRQ
jgi:hypothetical protein